MPNEPFTKDDLKAARARRVWLPEGHGIARDLSDKIVEWCVDHVSDEVAYCHGDKAEAYATFFSSALTDLPHALDALEEAWTSLDAIRESLDEIGAMCNRLGESAREFDLWMTIRNIQNMVATEQAVRAAKEG